MFGDLKRRLIDWFTWNWLSSWSNCLICAFFKFLLRTLPSMVVTLWVLRGVCCIIFNRNIPWTFLWIFNFLIADYFWDRFRCRLPLFCRRFAQFIFYNYSLSDIKLIQLLRIVAYNVCPFLVIRLRSKLVGVCELARQSLAIINVTVFKRLACHSLPPTIHSSTLAQCKNIWFACHEINGFLLNNLGIILWMFITMMVFLLVYELFLLLFSVNLFNY